MILRYRGMEILAPITGDEIFESFLSIARYRFKYFNSTGTRVYDFCAKIFGLKNDAPQWNPALLNVEICMCALISNASLE